MAELAATHLVSGRLPAACKRNPSPGDGAFCAVSSHAIFELHHNRGICSQCKASVDPVESDGYTSPPAPQTAGLALRTYSSPRSVVAQIEQLIAADKPSPHPPSVLARIVKLLCESRHYERAGVFLAVNGREVPRAFGGTQAATDEPRPELSSPMKIGGHTLGSLRVRLAPGHAFSSEERVLLRRVAEILALYLSGKGKYVVRKTREALRETATTGSSETHGYQPSSDKGSLEILRAAAGEKSRT